MISKAKLIEMDDVINLIEIAQIKAQYMASELKQEFFDLTEDKYIRFYFDNAGIAHEILFDYIIELGELITQAKELLKMGEDDKEKVITK